MAALEAARDRIREATRTYVGALTEEQLNTTLAQRPVDWGGELRSPGFILLHVITHAFHHKGQVVAMLEFSDTQHLTQICSRCSFELLEVIGTILLPGKQMRAFRECDHESGCVAARKPHEPYENGLRIVSPSIAWPSCMSSE
jgi:hypothetical protein